MQRKAGCNKRGQLNLALCSAALVCLEHQLTATCLCSNWIGICNDEKFWKIGFFPKGIPNLGHVLHLHAISFPLREDFKIDGAQSVLLHKFTQDLRRLPTPSFSSDCISIDEKFWKIGSFSKGFPKIGHVLHLQAISLPLREGLNGSDVGREPLQALS